MTGSFRFLQDCRAEGMYYGGIVRAPISKGTISTIQLPPNISKNMAFCRVADIPGEQTLSFFDQRLPVLTDRTIEYEGQPLMLIACSTAATLESISKQVHITYQQEPALPSLLQHESEQIALTETYSRGKSIDKTFSEAFQVFESSYYFPYRTKVSPDPEGAFSVYTEGKFDIWVPTNWPSFVRDAVSAVCGVPAANVHIHSLAFPPSFEEKLMQSGLSAVYASLLALKSKHPVRIIRMPEQPPGMPQHGSMIQIKSAVDKTGRLSALQVQADFNCGAVPLLPHEVIRRSFHSVLKAAPCNHMEITANLIKTNTPPAAPSPSFGSAHLATAVESEINRIAEMAGRSPGDYRLSMYGKSGEFDGLHLEIIEQIMTDSDYQRKYSAYEMMKKRREGSSTEGGGMRGIALAASLEGNGFTTPLESRLKPNVAVRLDTEQQCTIITSAAVRKTSLDRTLRELAAGILELSVDAVTIDGDGLMNGIDSGPSVLSRNITVLTPLVRKCCEAIQKKRFRSPLPIEAKRSSRIAKQNIWNRETGTGKFFQVHSFAAAVMELEYDPITLEASLREIWLYADCGNVIDEKRTKETIEAGLIQALEWTGIRQPRDVALNLKIFGNPKNNQPGSGELLPFSVIPPAFLSALSQAGNFYVDSLPQYPQTTLSLTEES